MLQIICYNRFLSLSFADVRDPYFRYISKQKKAYYDEAKKVGVEVKKPGEITLESEFETIKKVRYKLLKSITI